jgi:protein-disulfide isomerase/uncharacterized membrane protein
MPLNIAQSRSSEVSDVSTGKKIKRLPYRVYFGTVLALCVAGLALSGFLAVSHYRVHTDPGYHSFCALSKAINCDTVSSSPYSILWSLPVAVWGIADYAFMLILVSFAGFNAQEGQRSWAAVLLAALVFGLSSLIFAGISAFKIGSYCILCIATYAINFFLVYMVWIIRRRYRAQPFLSSLRADVRLLWSQRRMSIPVATAFVVGLVLMRLFFPAYWEAQPPAASVHVRSGVTADGHPWIGAEQPLLEIVEFSDYQCFQCRKMHYYLRTLVARYPEKIRLVHRNYPMDHEFNPIVREPFHVGSGQMSLLAIHAAASGKFLDVNDLLFSMVTSRQSIRIAEIAEKAALDSQLLAAALQHEPYHRQLRNDIRDGIKLGIQGTPSYLINGRIYEGSIPVEILKPVLEVASAN